MDPEKQPLLFTPGQEVRRRFRALSPEEVQHYRTEATWRRTRCCIIFLFYSIMVTFLSIITCLLLSASCTDKVEPGVSLGHLSFAPLMSKVINTHNI